MKLITERVLIREDIIEWRSLKISSPLNKKLAALDPETATVDDVCDVMGIDDYGSYSRCFECQSQEFPKIRIGDSSLNESYICESCIRKAMAMLEGGQ